MIWEILSSLIVGGGVGAACVKAYGAIKVKKMDIAFEERKQFVKEVNELRDKMNALYDKHNDLMRENAKLEIKVMELERNSNFKTEKLNQLKEIVKEYQSSIAVDAESRLVNQVIELID